MVSLQPPLTSPKDCWWSLSLSPPRGTQRLRGKMEVSSGLEKLLAEPLMYEDCLGRYAGHRNIYNHEYRI
jgi:hypothetical protein